MEFAQVLRMRQSVRQYNDRMVEQEDIRRIIDAALLGPVVRRHQLHLSVIRDRSVMKAAEQDADEFFQKEDGVYLYNAPVWIILSGRKYREMSPENNLMWNNNLYWNTGSLIENMELQAAELGLCSCSVNSVIAAMQNRPGIRTRLGIPEGFDALGSLVIGYPDTAAEQRSVNPELIGVTYIG